MVAPPAWEVPSRRDSIVHPPTNLFGIEGLGAAPRALVRRLGFAPSLRRLLDRGPLASYRALGRQRGWESAARQLLADGAVAMPAGLHAVLRRDSNMEVELELLLTALRRAIALDAPRLPSGEAVAELVTTLAAQAYCNAYVWQAPEDERAAVRRASDNADPAWLRVALPLMYGLPLPESDADATLRDAPAGLRDFVAGYRATQTALQRIREQIPVFGSLSAAVASPVRAAYERHPYPRWVTLRDEGPLPSKRELSVHFEDHELSFLDQPFNLLEAGCGTGHGAMQAALARAHASVTAIDFTLASIAYAAMMAERLGARNARFIRMDLNDLPQLEETFDYVRCIGVLHHLPDPVRGGRAIASRLRRGGIVRFSVYSRLSRRELVRLRHTYDLRPDLTDDEARERRHRILLEEPETVDDKIPLRADFFDLDRFRDLLCHPLERTYSIPELAELVDAMGITFRGLGKPSRSRDHLWTRYPRPGQWRNWRAWEAFEERYPDAFGSLYQVYGIKT